MAVRLDCWNKCACVLSFDNYIIKSNARIISSIGISNFQVFSQITNRCMKWRVFLISFLNRNWFRRDDNPPTGVCERTCIGKVSWVHSPPRPCMIVIQITMMSSCRSVFTACYRSTCIGISIRLFGDNNKLSQLQKQTLHLLAERFASCESIELCVLANIRNGSREILICFRFWKHDQHTEFEGSLSNTCLSCLSTIQCAYTCWQQIEKARFMNSLESVRRRDEILNYMLLQIVLTERFPVLHFFFLVNFLKQSTLTLRVRCSRGSQA